MGRGIACALASLLIFGAVPGSALAQSAPATYKAYQQALLSHGLAPLVPASSAFAPGYIYKLTKDANGRSFVKTVCSQAFLTKPTQSNIALPNTQKATDLSLNFGLKFLPPALASKIQAALGSNFSQVRSVDLSLEGLRVQEVAEANSLSPTGAVVKRKMNPACGANLEDQATSEGKFVDATFMVVRATDAASFSYRMKEATAGGVALKASFETTLSGEAGWKFKRNNAQTFVASRDPTAPPIYIAADIIRLDNAARAGTVSSVYNADLRTSKATDEERAVLADAAGPAAPGQ